MDWSAVAVPLVVEYVIPILGSLFLALGSAAIAYLSPKIQANLNVSLDEKFNGLLHAALDRASSAAVEELRRRFPEGPPPQAVAQATAEVMSSVRRTNPDAVAHFKLDTQTDKMVAISRGSVNNAIANQPAPVPRPQ